MLLYLMRSDYIIKCRWHEFKRNVKQLVGLVRFNITSNTIIITGHTGTGFRGQMIQPSASKH